MISTMRVGCFLLLLIGLLQSPLVIRAAQQASAAHPSNGQAHQTVEEAEDDAFDEEDDDANDESSGNQRYEADSLNDAERYDNKARIRTISIQGNVHVPIEPIMHAIPFQTEELFVAQRTTRLIQNVYNLGYFRDVQVYIEPISDTEVDLVVAVTEKQLLDGVQFHGNKHLSEKEITKKIDFAKVPAIDSDDIPKYIKILKKLYQEKDYHDVTIAHRLHGDERHVTLHFDIDEGAQTLIKRVRFHGNTYFRGKQLRSLLFTREDWIGGFIDRAGSYQPEAVEADKYVIENYYQSNGFYHAKVTKTTIDIDPVTKGATVTFYIFEGEQYTIGTIHAPGNDLATEEQILALLPIWPGQIYSKERVREAMETLRTFWGNFGRINAEVEPAIQPDDSCKTVAITLYSEVGVEVKVNKINIIGHNKTHDKVIRRQLLVEEGARLTLQALDFSKARVESLGYFDTRDGVNWRINRIAPDLVDLDLVVKEVKTGRFEAQMGFGGSMRDIASPAESFTVGVSLAETNLLGRGLVLNGNASITKQERNIVFSFTDPWLFDKPIHATSDFYIKRSFYDDFKFIKEQEINEGITGGSIGIGALSRKLYDSTISAKLGADAITYKQTPVVRDDIPASEHDQLQAIFNRRFTSGIYVWTGVSGFKDIRNHPVHPSRGYQWSSTLKIAFHGVLKDNPQDSPGQTLAITPSRVSFGYAKFDAEGSWYTPLIGERDLVLCLHGHAGVVASFKHHSIPFRELYNIGGPASVRGFLFGEIGPMFYIPQFNQRDMIGAKNAFWFNTELVFPIASDFSIKGAFFYDGGAGWNTPNSDLISPQNLKNNSFAFRHAVGFGVRILRPSPVKIDWGFKLDRKKGESPSEVHFGMYHEF
ncbi:MAG: outer membrane protein assembly factor BamA [Candidatus Babeliales bacterium]